MLKIWKMEKNANDNYAISGEIVDISKNGIKVACGKGSIIIKEIQEIGSKKMDVSTYLNGHTIDKGTLLE
jgi:methionyl-tRNA formyltransferase